LANRSKRLSVIAALADRREQAAAGRLRRGRNEIEGHRTTLSQLLRYRQDYQAHLEASGGRAVQSHKIKNLQLFIDNLDVAIQLVQDRVRTAAGECDQQLRNWMSTRSRARAVHTVIDRDRVETARRESRHEQLEADDRSARTARNPRE